MWLIGISVLLLIVFFLVASTPVSTSKVSPNTSPSPATAPKQENPVTLKYTQEEHKAQRIVYYKQSNLMTPIIKFLTQHGTPNKVIIRLNSIESYYTGGVDRFDFITHGIADFEMPAIFDRKVNTSESFYFACAINELLNSPFDVCENNTVVSFRHSDGELVVGNRLEYVKMTRTLQHF